ncbi:hypothetical protein METP3_02812 [Methanosarcinales archaeon]|nr:hypothetical protein METP3_02812 [Methanosarcinales archaeon]
MENSNTHDAQNEDTRSMTKLVFGTVSIWFLLAFVGGMMGIFAQPDTLYVPLFVLVPIIGFTLAYSLSMKMQNAVNRMPLWLITISHAWRFVGIYFIISAIVGVLPPQFGYPEGLGDVIAAIFSLPLAFAIRKKNRSPRLRTAFIAWNVFGLIDLISAISLGILYSPGSLGVLRTDLSTAAMTIFPVNLIPTFFVPLFILLHMLALRRSGELAG